MREVSQSPALIPSTSRTLSHHHNSLLPHTRIQQLPPIRLPEIHPHLARSPSAEKLLRIPKLRSKLRTHLIPHGISASPNARTHRRHQILYPRSILLPHPLNSPLDDPRHCPSPPGMKRPHNPL